MPGTVYTVASGKGGVGKTTTAVNLAVTLWRAGRSVAVVDADLGMANLAAVLDLQPEMTIHDVLAGEATLEEAVVEAKGGDLLVLPGSRELSGFAAANPRELRDVLDDLAARCEFVIVDTGAGLGYEDVLPLGLADAVVLVSSPNPAALGDTRKTAELAALVDTPVSGLVVTRAVEGTDSEAMAAEIGTELLGTIPEDPVVVESTVAGDPLESHAPDSAAAAAYRELADTILDARPAGDTGAPGTDQPDAGEEDAAASGSGATTGDEPTRTAAASADGDGPDDDAPAASTGAEEDGGDTAVDGDAAEVAEGDPADAAADAPEENSDAGTGDEADGEADSDADSNSDERPNGEGGQETDGDGDEGERDEEGETEGEQGQEQEQEQEGEREPEGAEDGGGSGGLRGWLGRLFS